jgi:hypothetical protein
MLSYRKNVFEILAKIKEKEAKFFFKNLPGAYKDLI